VIRAAGLIAILRAVPEKAGSQSMICRIKALFSSESSQTAAHVEEHLVGLPRHDRLQEVCSIFRTQRPPPAPAGTTPLDPPA
jgi:hypothetical protein